jgi:hypothetical protein
VFGETLQAIQTKEKSLLKELAIEQFEQKRYEHNLFLL